MEINFDFRPNKYPIYPLRALCPANHHLRNASYRKRPSPLISKLSIADKSASSFTYMSASLKICLIFSTETFPFCFLSNLENDFQSLSCNYRHFSCINLAKRPSSASSSDIYGSILFLFLSKIPTCM